MSGFKRKTKVAALVGAAAAMAAILPSGASSHREAPLITEDPVADNTDVYAFVSPDRPDTVTLVANWIPLEEPNGGPNFFRFGDDVRYQIHIDNDGNSHPDITYEWRFSTQVQNSDTFLYNTGPITSLTDPDFNIRQTYTVAKVEGRRRTVVASNVPTPPVNIGPRSTPDYDSLAAEAVHSVGGTKLFAGQRDDPFFVDLGSIFDLAGLRPLNGAHAIPLPGEPGVDGVGGFNTHSIAIQVPISEITRPGEPVIGVWSQTQRQQVRVLQPRPGNPASRVQGRWVNVSRLGMPLVNEVVIPLRDKDRFNLSDPSSDGQFLSYVLDPEPARLIPLLYGSTGITVPPAPRNDLVDIFLKGVSGLNRPAGVTPSEMIRLNTSIKPTTTDPNAQSRLGLLGGEADGFPNGRRLVDDVVDIELRALAGGTPLTPSFNKSPNNILGDGVDANDKPFMSTFPYVPSPHQGYSHDHH